MALSASLPAAPLGLQSCVYQSHGWRALLVCKAARGTLSHSRRPFKGLVPMYADPTACRLSPKHHAHLRVAPSHAPALQLLILLYILTQWAAYSYRLAGHSSIQICIILSNTRLQVDHTMIALSKKQLHARFNLAEWLMGCIILMPFSHVLY